MTVADFHHDPAHAEMLDLLAVFSRFGATPEGGVSRLACDPHEGEARACFTNWLTQNGFEVRIDQIGNIFGLVDFGVGDPELAFFCGSHLDSQPDGGRFDGALGVITAMVVAKTLKSAVERGDLVPVYRHLVVVSWTSEEGARFQPSLLGSGVFCAAIPPDQALAIRDAAGISVKSALSEIGCLGSDVIPRPGYYFELHIEQGTRLETTGTSIGIVERCWGAVKLRVCVHGRADHTGPTPMHARKDALLAASHLVVSVNALSKAAASDLYTSVGRMEIAPNSPNTIAETVRLWIELRSPDQVALQAALQDLKAEIARLPEVEGCAMDIETEGHRPVTEFDPVGCDIVDAAALGAGLNTMRMSTIAGHDAINLQTICPASLIFVPSKDGISHAPDEFTSDADVIAGYEASRAAIAALLTTRPKGNQHSRRAHK